MFAAVSYSLKGFFNFWLTVPAVIGSIAGGQIGSLLGKRMGAQIVKRLFTVVGIIFAIKLLAGI